MFFESWLGSVPLSSDLFGLMDDSVVWWCFCVIVVLSFFLPSNQFLRDFWTAGDCLWMNFEIVVLNEFWELLVCSWGYVMNTGRFWLFLFVWSEKERKIEREFFFWVLLRWWRKKLWRCWRMNVDEDEGRRRK